MTVIRKARATDIDAVARIYDAIHSQEEKGDAVIGWARGVYPTRETAAMAFEADELYVLEADGTIVAAAKINQKQEAAYFNIPWHTKADPEEVLVLHTLVVDPAQSGHSYGPMFVDFYEQTAGAMHCKALRIDTNERNHRARKLYKKLGYIESGIIPTVFNGIEGVNLVCLEKPVKNEGSKE